MMSSRSRKTWFRLKK